MNKPLTLTPPLVRSAIKWVIDEVAGVHGRDPDFTDPLVCYEYCAASLFYVQTRVSPARASYAKLQGSYEAPRTVLQALELGYGLSGVHTELFVELVRRTGLGLRSTELYFVDGAANRGQRFVEIWWDGAWRLFDPSGGWHPWRGETHRVCSLDDTLDGRPFEVVINKAIPSTAGVVAARPDYYTAYAKSPVIGRVTDGFGVVRPPAKPSDDGLVFDLAGLPSFVGVTTSGGRTEIRYGLDLPVGDWTLQAEVRGAPAGVRLKLGDAERDAAAGETVSLASAGGPVELTAAGDKEGAYVVLSGLKALKR